jgi:predicted SAM-dependent methyltransferase
MSASTPQSVERMRVINLGAGVPAPSRFDDVFSSRFWEATRLDIDPMVKPDIVGSAVDMRGIVASDSFEAAWSSHQLEHIFEHEVIPCLGEIRRILKPHGFALITCPDIESIAETIANGTFDEPVYDSPAGPIRPADMLFGHQKSVGAGNHYMGHKTGFTADRLGRMAMDAGFHEVRVRRAPRYDLWALMMMPDAQPDAISRGLQRTFLKGLFDE